MPRTLTIELLGELRCRVGDDTLELKSRKARGVVAYLALAHHKRAQRAALAGVFWPSAGEQQARQSLRQCLSALRRAFGDEARDALLVEGDTISLDPARVEVDVDLLVAASDSADCQQLMRAAEAARGPLLRDLVFGEERADNWLRDERVRVQAVVSAALFRCAEQQAQAATPQDVERTYWRILELNPACEEAHRALMRLHADAGRRSEALAQYRACEDALARHVDAEPSAETKALFSELRSAAQPDELAAPRERPTLPLPEKPAIAVLAFDNLSGDPQREYLGDGVSEEITTALSQFSSIYVIARNSAFAYKGRGLTVPEIGRQLGVHYVLEGSAQQAGDRLRVNAQLIEAEQGRHVWSQRYDGSASDLFAFQDDIVQRIVATAAGRIEAAALARAQRKTVDDLDAYDCVLRGKYHHHRYTAKDSELAVELFSEAIKRRPDYVLAHGWLACAAARLAAFTMSRSQKVNSGDYQKWLDERMRDLKRVSELDTEESECLRLIGEVMLFQRDYDEAERYIRRAYRYNPNDDRILSQMAALLAFSGDAEQALQFARAAIRANPFHPGFYAFNLGRVLMLLERYAEAAEAIRAADPPQNRYRAYLAACYAALDREDDAARVRDEILDGDPDFTLGTFAGTFLYRDDAVSERLLSLMRRAGLPD